VALTVDTDAARGVQSGGGHSRCLVQKKKKEEKKRIALVRASIPL
jgi:hypothetical protein